MNLFLFYPNLKHWFITVFYFNICSYLMAKVFDGNQWLIVNRNTVTTLIICDDFETVTCFQSCRCCCRLCASSSRRCAWCLQPCGRWCSGGACRTTGWWRSSSAPSQKSFLSSWTPTRKLSCSWASERGWDHQQKNRAVHLSQVFKASKLHESVFSFQVVLELCRAEEITEAETIEMHLERIRTLISTWAAQVSLL